MCDFVDIQKLKIGPGYEELEYRVETFRWLVYRENSGPSQTLGIHKFSGLQLFLAETFPDTCSPFFLK